MRSALRFGFAIPQRFDDPDASISSLTSILRDAESAGLHSLWVQEQLLGHDQSFEPLTNLAFAAAQTDTIELGAAAFIAPLRNPVQFAKALATLDQLSRGRLIAGMALGDVPAIYDAVGVPYHERVARLEEAILVMRRLWSEESVSIDGRFTTLIDAAMEPKPVRVGGPRIWFGGKAPAALDRAVHLGSGWIGAGGSSTEDFAVAARYVKEALAASGADHAAFTIAKKVYISVDADRDRAYRKIEEWFRVHWAGITDPVALAKRVGVFGNPADVVFELRRIRDLGAQLIILNPVRDEAQNLARLAHDVIPYV